MVRRVVGVLALVVLLPVSGYAQEAILSGTVTDSTGGVLPGVTITATHVTTGNDPTLFTLNESNAKYGRPNSSNTLAYSPRMLQFGFRTQF